MARVRQEVKQELHKSRKMEQDYLAKKEALDEEARKINTDLQVCVGQMVLDIPN
jgi:hypothetical protein